MCHVRRLDRLWLFLSVGQGIISLSSDTAAEVIVAMGDCSSGGVPVRGSERSPQAGLRASLRRYRGW